MKFGIHVSKKSIDGHAYKDILDAIKTESHELSLSAVQIFTNVPQTGAPAKVPHADVKDYCEKKDIALYVHGPYVSVAIWRLGVGDQEKEAATALRNKLQGFIVLAENVGAKGLVIHLPKKSIEVIVGTLVQLAKHDEFLGRVPLILEMPASRPDEFTYETAEKLNALTKAIKEGLKNAKEFNWGICVDTAHQWSCGVKMNEQKEVDQWIDDLSEFTKQKIKLLHLNGASGTNFGTGKDVHMIPFSSSDAIWGGLITEAMRKFMAENEEEMAYDTKNLYRHLHKKECKVIKNSSIQSIINWAKKYDYDIVCEINITMRLDSKFAIDVINSLIME